MIMEYILLGSLLITNPKKKHKSYHHYNKSTIQEIYKKELSSVKFSNRLKIFLESPSIENNKEKVYYCSAGAPTIGVGHKLLKHELSSGKIRIGEEEHEWKKGLSREARTTLLFQDLKGVEDYLNSLNIEFEQEQFDALGAFVFNIGINGFKASTLLKKLKEGKFEEVPAQMKRWNKARDPKTKQLRVVNGLVKRRNHEIKFWNGLIDVE